MKGTNNSLNEEDKEEEFSDEEGDLDELFDELD